MKPKIINTSLHKTTTLAGTVSLSPLGERVGDRGNISMPLVSILTLCLCALAFITPLSAQPQKTWQWVQQLGGTSWDITSGIACDAKNNLYVAGSFYNTLTCGSKKTESKGDADIFIARFNENGNLKDMWSAGGKGRDEATCLCTTTWGNIAIGGLLTDSATFDKITIKEKGPRLYIASLNAKGAFTWVKTLTIKGAANLFLIDAASDSSLYAAGAFSGSLTFDEGALTSRGKNDIFLLRLSPSGAIEKYITFGSEENDLPEAISASQSGVTLSGVYGKPLTIANLTLTPKPEAKTNAFIIELDKNLTPGWINTLYGEKYCKIASLNHDAQGNLYASGSFNLTLNLSHSPLGETATEKTDTTFTSQGLTDGYLLKYTPKGTLQWGRSFGSKYYDYADHVNTDNLEGAVVTGSVGDTLQIDSLMIIPRTESTAALALQFSPTGQATWGDYIAGQGRNFVSGTTLDKKGNIYLTGSFSKTFEKETQNLTSKGDEDIFLAKYTNCLNDQVEIFGDTIICPGIGTELTVKRNYTKVTWNDTIPKTYTLYADQPGRYWVSVMDKKGCVLSDTVTVANTKLPIFTLGNDTTIHTSDTLLLKAPQQYGNYLWQDHSTGTTCLATASNGNAGTYLYTLSVKDTLGCAWTDTIAINFVADNQWVDINTIVLTTYPNPTRDQLYYTLNTKTYCKMIVELADERGRILQSQYIGEYAPGEVRQIDVSNLVAGNYCLHIKNASTGRYKSASIIKK